jgi:hypothetical protein
MADGQMMVPFVALASMDRAARDQALQPLVLTMLPGPPAQKTAVAAVAVTQQAQEAVQNERRVANQVVAAVGEAAEKPDEFDRQALARFPALRRLATDEFVTRIKEIPTPAKAEANQELAKEAVQALKAAIELSEDGKKLPKAHADKYPALTEHLSDAEKAQLFEK